MTARFNPQMTHIPPIVRIVLSQLGRLRSEGMISDTEFEAKLRRLEGEELSRLRLFLHRNESLDGLLRFEIKSRANEVLAVVECGTAPPSEAAMVEC